MYIFFHNAPHNLLALRKDNTSDYAQNHFKNEIMNKKTENMALNIYKWILLTV